MEGKKEYLATYSYGNGADVSVWEIDVEGFPLASYPLALSLKQVNHSATRFAWGYRGSGPALLAFAILCDHLNDPEKALDLFQEFNADVIAFLDSNEGWTLTDDQIESAIAAIYARRTALVRVPTATDTCRLASPSL
jgi:hypothetical protein